MEIISTIISPLLMISKLFLFLGTLIFTILFVPAALRSTFNKENKQKRVREIIRGAILFILHVLCCVTLRNEFPNYEMIFELNAILWGVDTIVNLMCWEVDFNKKVDKKQEEEKEAA